ncbi:MAG: DNA polymerase I, partial [Candidatus Dormiibacterota bacterium]
LEKVLEAVPTMPPGRVRRALEEHVKQARLSKWTATICLDVNVDLDLDAARLFHYDEDEVRELFDRLEFRTLLTRLPGKAVDGDAAPAPFVAAADVVPVGDLQAPVTEVITVLDAHEAADAVERLRAAGSFAVRTIMEGNPRTGDLIGVALSPTGEDIAFYVPVWHASLVERNADESAVAAVEALLADATLPKRGYDLKREVLAWRRRGITVAGLQFDAMLAAYLTNSRLKVPTLPVLAHDLCALQVESEESLLGSGRSRRGVADIPIDEASAYYGAWIGLLDPVGAVLVKDMERANVTRLHDEMELPLVPILAAMEVDGVAVDCDLLASISAEMHTRITEIESELQDTAGYTFNPGSTQQLARFLYDDLGLASGRKTKTGRSTDADSLESLRGEHPVVELILEWRQLTKLKSTYVDSLPLLCSADSRVHTSFNQAVATTGRLSSSDPNLQNIPVRTQWGQRIRRAFHADAGRRLVSADYSQVELRVLAHVTGEPELIAAFQRGEDIHRRTAAEVYSVAPEDVTQDMRRIAKVVNFGVVYGLSDFGLARDTGMSREDAHAFIDAYFHNFPGVTTYLEQVRNHAREYGWVETFIGRRRYIADIRAANRQLRFAAERMAVNMPIQGGAADIMKQAMILVDRALREAGLRSRMLLQVHDELLLEAPVEEIDVLIPLLRERMGSAEALKVPLEVDVKIGDNWGDMTPVARS